MKTFLKNNFVIILSTILTVLSLKTIETVDEWRNNFNRAPASVEKSYRLILQNVRLNRDSRLKRLEDVFVRVTFNGNQVMEFNREERFSLFPEEEKSLDVEIPILKKWIQDDKLVYKVEIVQPGLIENVLFRCSQVSKKLSEYNRSYQCSVPGDQLSTINYRLEEAPTPGQGPIAKSF